MDKYYMFVYETVATLFDYFDTDALLVFSEGSKLKERMRTTLWQWGEDVRGLLAEGVLCRGLDMYTETYEYALKRAEDTASVYMDAFARGSYDTPTKALCEHDGAAAFRLGRQHAAFGRRPDGCAAQPACPVLF